MEWQDKGLILGVRKHGETSAIVELMTLSHGRHLGLVRGGRSRQMRPVLQPGNNVLVQWQARLSDHLGTYSIEADELRAARLMESRIAMYGIQMLAAHLRLLPERDPHVSLYNAAQVIVDNFSYPDIVASLMVRFELVLLEDLGFGLGLDACAGAGDVRELAYVSPKSGLAVSRSVGRPWADRLLVLPRFLNRYDAQWGRVPSTKEIKNGFELSGFFLDRHVYGIRQGGPPKERAAFLKAVMRNMEKHGGDDYTPCT